MRTHCTRATLLITLAMLALPKALAALRAPVQGASAAFRSEKVTIHSGKHRLAADLLLPDGAGRFAAAILIPGSRGSTFLPGVAEVLAMRGIIVLDLHKRGVGGSTGRWDRQGFGSRADDVIAGIEFLRGHTAVDSGRIGVVGHSQGGWIAQMVAAERTDLAFAALLAAPGQSVRDQILTDERIHRARSGMPDEQADAEVRSLGRKLGALRATAPVCRALRAHYLCHIIDFDPASYIERISVPVLALYGELDPMSPPHVDVPLLRAGLDRAQNPDVTIHVFPAANHVFRAARTGLRDEYASLDTAYVAGFLDTLSSWVLARTGMASAGEAGERNRPAALEPAGTRRRVNQLSIHGGMTRLDYQDVIHTPFVHHALTPLSLGIAYRRDARWIQFAHVRLDGARSRLRRYTVEMHGHENLAHEYFLTDASYGLGRRLGAGSSAVAGLAASLGLQAVSYGYGVEENFGYVIHPSLDAWFERERRLSDRQLVRGRLSAPLLSWLARSPYMVNDDRFIENIADGNPLSIALNFLRDGKPAGWGARQAAEATIDHELAIFSRLSVGTSYRFALLRATDPRPLTSLRNSIGITSSLRY